jgi:hypothetical protein
MIDLVGMEKKLAFERTHVVIDTVSEVDGRRPPRFAAGL